MKKIISMFMILVMGFTLLSAGVVKDSSSDILYTTDIAYGKKFIGGENSVVNTKEDFNSSISNIVIKQHNGKYNLSFIFEKVDYSLTCDIISAKSNNLLGDHYILSPAGNLRGQFDVVNISFTTCANDNDLLPANLDLIGKSVLTIIIQDSVNNDVYYWQAQMQLISRSNNTFSLSTDQSTINRGNEYYYLDSSAKERYDEVHIELDNSINCASKETYEFYKNRNNNTNNRIISVNNPFYDLGVPNSAFTSVTDGWELHRVWMECSEGGVLPIYYYINSYTKYGDPNIYTYTMIIGYQFQRSASGTLYYENGESYYKADAMMKIEHYVQPHTVKYYVNENLFDYMLGGEELTEIYEPAVEVKKNSTGIPHVVIGRTTYSNATPNNLLGLGSLVLRKTMVGVLDLPSYGFASVLVDILDLIDNASTSVSDALYTGIHEEYYSDYNVQISRYGKAIGSVKSTVKGNLQTVGDYLAVRAWLATPSSYGSSSVTSSSGVFYVTARVR